MKNEGVLIGSRPKKTIRRQTKLTDKQILDWLEANYQKPYDRVYEVSGPRLYPSYPADSTPGFRVYDGRTGTGHEDQIGSGKTLREAITNTVLHPYGRR
jgi:hypothetical protein